MAISVVITIAQVTRESRVQQRMERSFRSQWGQPLQVRPTRGGERWQPPTDVYETPAAFLVHTELPGMKQGAIRVLIAGQTLVIAGVRQQQRPSIARVHQININHGAFQAEVYIPGPFLAEHASAHYDDGVLQILLPKQLPPDV